MYAPWVSDGQAERGVVNIFKGNVFFFPQIDPYLLIKKLKIEQIVSYFYKYIVDM